MNLRQFVKACASDKGIVAAFNAMSSSNLPCPIQPLVEPIFPLELSDEELYHIARFVAWVDRNQWLAASDLKLFRHHLNSNRRRYIV